MRIVLLGNCHVNAIYDVLCKTTHGNDIARIQLKAGIKLDQGQLALVRNADIVAVISTFIERLRSCIPEGLSELNLSLLPHVRGRQFHPDLVYADKDDGSPLRTLLERNNSAIALYAYLHGATLNDTKQLFNPEVYKLLGFYDERPNTRNWLLYQEKKTGYHLIEKEAAWMSRGAYLHTPNHPALSVFASISKQFAQKHKLKIIFDQPEHILEDRAARQSIWPCYPELADQFGLEGSYCFKVPEVSIRSGVSDKVALNLDEFIESSFKIYGEQGAERITSDALNRIFKGKTIDDLFHAIRRGRKSSTIVNPYSALEQHQFWRRSIASVKPEDVDPVVQGKFIINKEDKVATAGSCFAQHISKALTKSGFIWLQTETAPTYMEKQTAESLGYSVFSARYGNIYTARQLVQLYDRAFGSTPFEDSCWTNASTGRFVDPFRPYVIDDGFESYSAYFSDLKEHLAAVKRMFLELDVFVFTLGLTEAWIRRVDGAVMPFHPGVVGAEHDPCEYEFKNFSIDEVRSDLSAIKGRLFEVNPRAKMILSVSPVPLIATYENNHVLVSTTYSKAVLRVAADEAARNDMRVAYFPSYELISSHYNSGSYFSSDKREVTPEGVAHVMRLLLKHYTASHLTFDPEVMAEAEVVCDEEELDT